MINLDEEEYKSGRYKTQFEEFGLIDDFEEAEMTGANILTQNSDGECIYLKDGKCSIHDIRPKSCRAFFCDSDDIKFREMIEMIEGYKKANNKKVNKKAKKNP